MSKASESRQDIVPTIYRSASIAQEHGHEYVTLEHLLSALLEDDDIKAVVEALGANHQSIVESMLKFLDGPFISITNTIPHPTKSFDEVVTRCVGTVMFSARPNARPIDLFVHLLQHPAEDSFAVTTLVGHGITALAVKRHLSHGVGGTALAASEGAGAGERT
ncbi:MAG: hypothetical protein EOP83_31970, partial [Verrucomicrobiaceae bacterium]